jgi:hypothetical protein
VSTAGLTGPSTRASGPSENNTAKVSLSLTTVCRGKAYGSLESVSSG